MVNEYFDLAFKSLFAVMIKNTDPRNMSIPSICGINYWANGLIITPDYLVKIIYANRVNKSQVP